MEIAGLTADSRRVAPGFLFAALPGLRADGRAFIADAVARGAAAVLAPTGTRWPEGVPRRPLLEDPEPRRALARLAAAHAGAQPEIVVAVTGTNGKTSTVEFLRQIFALGGHGAASLGTLGVAAPGFATSAGLTTPDPVALAQMLAQLAAAGVTRAAIEASSHGLDQFRLDGLGWRRRGSPTSRATISTITARSPPTAPPSCGCSPSCCPRARRPWRRADMEPETLAELRAIAARRRLDLRTVGEAGEAIRLAARDPAPPTGRSWRSPPAARGARSRCRCRAGSRPTTPCWRQRWPRRWARRARSMRCRT